MAVLQVEYLESLAPARLDRLLNRSKEDVNQVLEDVRAILTALRRDGDAENLRWHRQYKADLTALESIVVPVYTRVWTPTDAWQNPLVYKPDTTVGRGYTLQSPGKDGVIEGSPAGGGTGDLDCDIIFSNGAFIQWPEGSQQ